jgi:hypothetical protein
VIHQRVQALEIHPDVASAAGGGRILQRRRHRRFADATPMSSVSRTRIAASITGSVTSV